MRILIRIGDGADLGLKVVAIFVEVPVFPARHVGIMRVGEADGEAPRAIVCAARQIVELARRVVGNLVVIFHLVGYLGNAGAGDRSHVVIPPVDALARLAVVRGPTEIGRIDVGRQAFFESVQLIRPHEMHLA